MSSRRSIVLLVASVAVLGAFGCDAPSEAPDSDVTGATDIELRQRGITKRVGVFQAVVPAQAAGASHDGRTMGVVAWSSPVEPAVGAVRGAKVAELVAGGGYQFFVRPTAETMPDGLPIADLEGVRPVRTLIGTLEDGATGLVLTSANAKRYRLTGAAVETYRAGLRGDAGTGDLLGVDVTVTGVLTTASDLEVLSYAPVAIFDCAAVDGSGLHLRLAPARSDRSRLDGALSVDEKASGEGTLPPTPRVVATGSCERGGDAYACQFQTPSEAYGTARFDVPGAAAASLQLVVERSDEAHSTIAFSCTVPSPEDLARRSEDGG